jgi:hypothetical protein
MTKPLLNYKFVQAVGLFRTFRPSGSTFRVAGLAATL